MIWTFLYHMKMVSAGLKMLTLKVHISISICDDYGLDADETWMHGNWFYTTDYGIFDHEVKATERSPPDNRARWIITRSKGFTRKDIEKISRSVRTYLYLVLTSQVQARSSIVGNSAPAVDARQV